MILVDTSVWIDYFRGTTIGASIPSSSISGCGAYRRLPAPRGDEGEFDSKPRSASQRAKGQTPVVDHE
jgi:hypothetical protein